MTQLTSCWERTEENEDELTGKAEFSKAEVLAAGEACKVIIIIIIMKNFF